MGLIDEPVTLEYFCKLNEFIARNEALEWDKLRTGSVAISGTDYAPPVPQEAAVRAELAADASSVEKALTAFCRGGTRATVLGRQQAHRSDAGKQDSAIPTYGCFAFALKPYEGRLPKIEDAPLFHKSEQEFKSPELFSEKIINGFGISHIKNPQWIDNHGKRRIMRA